MYKAVSIINGQKRSLFHSWLDIFNRSLIYRTDKPTLPGCICFTSPTLDHIINLVYYNFPCEGTVQLWKCEGRAVGLEEGLSRIDSRIESVLLANHESIFATDIILTEFVEQYKTREDCLNVLQSAS